MGQGPTKAQGIGFLDLGSDFCTVGSDFWTGGRISGLTWGGCGVLDWGSGSWTDMVLDRNSESVIDILGSWVGCGMLGLTVGCLGWLSNAWVDYRMLGLTVGCLD